MFHYHWKIKKNWNIVGIVFLVVRDILLLKFVIGLKKSILNEGFCYKEKFYGIESHRCLQMSPAVPFCHQKCSFCWRDLSLTKTKWVGDYDDPKTIIQDAIHAQNKLLCGFFW